MTLIREARAIDLNALLRLSIKMHEESGYHHIHFDDSKTKSVLENYVKGLSGETYALVAEAEGDVVGFLLGFVDEYLFSRERIACDAAIFVEPAHRGKTLGSRLIRQFREWAAAKGVIELCLGISSQIAETKTATLYESLGLMRVGGIHKQRLRR